MIRCNLNALLRAKGWTRYRLAAESGVHNAVLAKYAKNGVQEFNADTLNAICLALGCDVGDLIGYVPEGVGVVRFRLAELMAARGWSGYRLAQESGIQPIVISKYRNNAAPSPRLETLARLCGALDCGIGDLMEYVPAGVAAKPSSTRRGRSSKKR